LLTLGSFLITKVAQNFRLLFHQKKEKKLCNFSQNHSGRLHIVFSLKLHIPAWISFWVNCVLLHWPLRGEENVSAVKRKVFKGVLVVGAASCDQITVRGDEARCRVSVITYFPCFVATKWRWSKFVSFSFGITRTRRLSSFISCFIC
jgi:hypothetical protein